MTANNNDTDYTQFWKEGKLDIDEYYIQHNTGVIYTDTYETQYDESNYAHGLHFTTKDEYVKKVLAPVPTYEQWKSLKELLDSTIQTNQALAKKLKSTDDINKNLSDKCWEFSQKETDLTFENMKLRELLKQWVKYYPDIACTYAGSIELQQFMELVEKTSEVLNNG